jgi:hypothetical protein
MLMQHTLAPIACAMDTEGLSERLIVSHYENDYGAAVRSRMRSAPTSRFVPSLMPRRISSSR